MNITLTDRNAANVGGTSVQEEQKMNEELKGHLYRNAINLEVKRNEENCFMRALLLQVFYDVPGSLVYVDSQAKISLPVSNRTYIYCKCRTMT